MMRKEVTCAVEPGVAPRTLRFTLSTGDVDRMGDTIDPAGWQLDEYRANGVVLFAHRHDIPAIARTTAIGVVGDTLKGTAEFPPPGIHPLADTVYGLAKSGFLHAASVGFVPLAATPNRTGGYDYTSQILHEWSIVNVPALPQAQIEASLGARAAVEKWLGLDGGAVVLRLLDDEVVRLQLDDEATVRLEPRDFALAFREHLADTARTALAERARERVVVDQLDVVAAVAAVIGSEVGRQIRLLRGRVD